MEFEKLKEWLDMLVDNLEQRIQNKDFNTQIGIFNPDKHMHLEGVELAADIMGLELVERIYAQDRYPYKYSFMYRGVQFLNAYDRRLERFCKGDENVPV